MGRHSHRAILAGVVAVMALLVPATAVSAGGHSTTIVSFDPSAGEFPEGVAVNKTGDVFVSMALSGELLRFADGSSDYEVFGSIPGFTGQGAGFLGLAIDNKGNVYGAAQSVGHTGVWKFDRKTGDASLIPGTDQANFPNSIAFDKVGNMYFTDSFTNPTEWAGGANSLGAIWRVDRHGAVEKWFEGPELGGTNLFGIGPVGANGITYRQGTITVANTEGFSLWTLPVLGDGSAGDISPVTAFGFFIPDGIALDVHGNIYVASVGTSEVVRVNTDGSVELLAAGAADGLDVVSSVAFGTGSGNKQTLYAVNLALFSPAPNPALVAIQVDTPGMPMP